MKISRLGEAPDYRFSLANERTFLAWIRTALGFLAAGVGLDQLAPDFATPVIRELLANSHLVDVDETPPSSAAVHLYAT
ncbi:YidH family protein, partial [Escherichia sp. HC-CC]